ncbi:TIGR04255 family protein [Leptospirillum ferriphilum]|uniref:TIGR04255 family protein n=1 Tax=Leptospirillum ferriphilum TaxID=178606 RepID=UPI0009DB6CC3|nr:TIGR04255 family protein [Leptospirillum ferriphilum]
MVRKYSKPPITEALFDIQVELPKEVNIETIDGLSSPLLDRYPKKRPRRKFSTKIEFKGDNPPSTDSSDFGIDGFLFWTEDEKQVTQFRLDGFSFSRLKPYPSGGWEETYPQMVEFWNFYKDSLKPLLVKRVAVRYINLIEVPKPLGEMDWGSYFNWAPPVFGELPHQIEQFVHRTTIQFPEESIKAVITLLTGPPQEPSKTTAIFDLDVFKEIHLSLDQFKIDPLFKKLRGIKDDLFEAGLTETLKREFE